MNSLGLSYASSSDDDEETEQERHSLVPVPVAVVSTRVELPQRQEIEIEGLPSEPPGTVDPQVQARIARFLQLQRQQGDSSNVTSFQQNLQSKKEVANPSILHKVVEYFGIDELHTNFSPQVFDPYGLPLHEYTESITLEQKKRHEAKLQQQQQRTQIAFTHSLT